MNNIRISLKMVDASELRSNNRSRSGSLGFLSIQSLTLRACRQITNERLKYLSQVRLPLGKVNLSYGFKLEICTLNKRDSKKFDTRAFHHSIFLGHP